MTKRLEKALHAFTEHAIQEGYNEGRRDGIAEARAEIDCILDEIRAEINELYSYVEFDEDIKTSFNMVRLEEVQKVIDKYKAEKGGALIVKAFEEATNGDVIKAMFKGRDLSIITERLEYTHWWNAPYKAEGEDKE